MAAGAWPHGEFGLEGALVSTDAPPAMIPTPDRLAQPTLPAQPNQVDLGGQVYYFVCMACHGDRGQGLTPDWLDEWGLEEDGCWQSKCHAANHPPEGFELPRAIPAVVSPAVPARFATAMDLYEYLKEQMPWHAPGSLLDEEYWQVTAYLLFRNGIFIGEHELNPNNADRISLRQDLSTQVVTPMDRLTVADGGITPALVWLGGGGFIALIALFFFGRGREASGFSDSQSSPLEK